MTRGQCNELDFSYINLSIRGPGFPISLLVASIMVELEEYLFKKLTNSSISLNLNISDFALIYDFSRMKLCTSLCLSFSVSI